MKKQFVLYLSFLLNVAFIIVVYFQLDTRELSFYISSDTLYLPVIFRDIVMDHSKDIYWFVPPATCFFPDLVIYFIVNFIIKNFIVAKLITGIILCIMLLLGFCLLINESVYKFSPLHMSTGVNLMLLFHIFSLSAGDSLFTFYLTATNYHLGAYIISVFCLYLAVRYLRNRKVSPLVVLLLLYTLTFSSDFLTICHLTIPLFILIILLFLKKGYRLPAFYLLAVNCLGLLLGYGLYQFVGGSKSFHIFSLQAAANLHFDLHAVVKAYLVMLNYHFHFINARNVGSVIFILCIISFILSVVICIRKLANYFKEDEISNYELTELAYLLLFVSQVIVLYNTPAITGIFNHVDLIRYNVYVFYILIFNYAYLFYKLVLQFRFIKRPYLFPAAILIFFSFICMMSYTRTNMKQGADNLFRYYPDYVKKVDELCRQHHLKYGLADFWLAKPITMFSKNNLRVYQVYNDGCPYPHVVNLNWYYGTADGKTPPPVFEFVMMNNLVDSLVYKKLENHIIDTLINDDVVLVKVSPFIFIRPTCSITFIDNP